MSLFGSLGGILQQQAPAGGGGVVLESSTGVDNGTSNVTSCILTKPTGTASGDLLLAFICNDLDVGSSGEFSLAGWTEEFHLATGGGRLRNCTILSKVAGGSEPSSYTFAAATVNDGVAGVMLRLSGQNATWEDSVSTSNNYDNTLSPPSSNFTPTQNDCMVLQVMFAISATSVTATGAPSGYSTPITSGSIPTAGAAVPLVSVCSLTQTTAAATGTATWWTGNAGDGTTDSTTVAVAIAPA